jgi:hypothetical protein
MRRFLGCERESVKVCIRILYVEFFVSCGYLFVYSLYLVRCVPSCSYVRELVIHKARYSLSEQDCMQKMWSCISSNRNQYAPQV